MKNLQDQICILICLAPMLMYGAAERQYFIVPRNLTWDGARSHCQDCFKELVTLTPDNVQGIAKRLNSEHWIGLRKNFDSNNATSYSTSYPTSYSTSYSTRNSTSNRSMSWTRWANGDPLAFQNWYPGWPLLKLSFPKIDCCSCSCSCPLPATTTTTFDPTSFTDFGENATGNWSSDDLTATENMTDASGVTDLMGSVGLMWNNISTTAGPSMATTLAVEPTCSRSPAVLPEFPENYIEDSCVAMLAFGLWVEKSCSDLLPFVCYEDRFFGRAVVTDVATESAMLTWLPALGDISYYRVEVRGKDNQTVNQTGLTHRLGSLTAGSLYSVQVFPVKCERDLNPQNVTFYTEPNKVIKLTVDTVTETSISLSWNKPAGNTDIYRIKVESQVFETDMTVSKVESLIPGTLYTFTVQSGVRDRSKWSVESSTTAYTRPGAVSDLSASDITNDSLSLTWTPPEGRYTGFRVKAFSTDHEYFNKVVSQTSTRVVNLPMGSKIKLVVTALVNYTLEGDSLTIFNNTGPGPVSKLTALSTKNTSFCASWTPPPGSDLSFTVELTLDGKPVERFEGEKQPKKCFTKLKTSSKYTVVVHVVSGHLVSPPMTLSEFTLPSEPTNVKGEGNQNSITFTWTAPDNIEKATYIVNISSNFWGQSWSDTVRDRTTHTFNDLKSGSSYRFQVSTVAGGLTSVPGSVTVRTEPDPIEVGLSMMCSSSRSLLCDNSTTRQTVFEQLEEHFRDLLKEEIKWELQKV
ncbi:receptor-type tyrosine-protein phosphatase eta [Embiotoca jacksoni]|uniref:receptor-type tyrosine-protein phosphatase eta n=1 Tax=Embiotoca jacksoni TaxID=100190 RepID=UPI003703AF3E